ncbi:MAG TPA: ATP-binding protein [candidate division Zixibacteria bacterium]|nr:ATP-binding protein [candidate division Zixibacteria bacterium]
MDYELGRSPCHYLPTVLDRLADLNSSIIDPHERALLARANMFAYELTDNKIYQTNAKKLGKEILRDILTKESYIPEEEEIKLLYYLNHDGSVEIEQAQIERLIELQEKWPDPDDRICALLLAHDISLSKGELKEKIYELLESLPREEKLWPYATAYIMSNREMELPADILELAKEVSGSEEPAPYLDKVIWIKSLYDPNFGPRSFETRKRISQEIEQCDQPIDLLFVLGHMRNENVLENIQRNIEEVSGSLSFAPKVDLPIEARCAPTEDAIILGRGGSTIKQIGCQGTMYLGRVSEKGSHGLYGKKVLVDAVFPHVLFISGHRGSGKSYTLGVIAEELAKAQLGVGIILVDPIGIFWALKNKNTDTNENLLLEKWGLTPDLIDKIEVFTPIGIFNDYKDDTVDSPFALKPSDLHIEDWCRTFDIDRYEVRGTVLEKAMSIVTREAKDYSIDDIIDALDDPQIVNSYRSDSIQAIRSRMNAAKGWGIFSGNGTPLSRLSTPNKIAVLDISNPRIGDSLRALLVGIIARKILEARIKSSRGELFEESGEDDGSIPVTWLLIDEAHVLVPQNKKTAASDPLIEYAKQGRKPGCALVLVTQQPSAMHKDIMSQIDLMITHLLTFEDDIKAFLKRVPSSVPENFEESDFIRSMPTGVGLLSDQKTQNRSLVVKIRPRTTLHAGREAVPKSLRSKMRDQKQATIPVLDKRDVIIESAIEVDKLIPEPIQDKRKVVDIEESFEPELPSPVKKPSKKPVSGDIPIPEEAKFPAKMLLSILERKLEYGQNTFLFDGSKSTKFDKHQRSGLLEGSVHETIPAILSELEDIGWETAQIIPENTTVTILMRLESATLGMAYAIVGDKTALSFLVVAKERFKKNTFDKIFGLR